MNDYYSLLGIARDASSMTIKQAAQAQLSQLKSAYTVLSNATNRAAYDKTLAPGQASHYSLIGVPSNAQDAALKHATEQRIKQIKQAVNVLCDESGRRAYDTELKAPLEVTQTDTGSFHIKPKQGVQNNTADVAAVAVASDQVPHDINPYDAPDAQMDDAQDEDYVLTSRLRRLGAALLDGIAFLVVALVAMLFAFFAMLLSGVSMQAVLSGASAAEGVMALFIGLISIGFLALMLLNLIWWHRYGQSVGKRMLGIKIVRTDGSRCGLRRIILYRGLPIQLLSLIPLIGAFIPLIDSLFIFQHSRKCIHDMIADTVVVQVQ